MRELLLATAVALLGSSALTAPEALTRAEARHLLARTGFDPAPAEIDAFVGRPAHDAVRDILGAVRQEPNQPMPGWASGWMYPEDTIWTLGQTAEELFFANRALEIKELRAWWFGEMIATPTPLTERLTLFWHDHFATSVETVENSQLLARQNAFLRRHAAGNFADLAHGILRDPAMLIYLSNTENRVGEPNENLAREFMELFTLGEGRGYVEVDVKEAARALTGHTFEEDGTFVVYRDDHDPGQKTILGQTGRFDASGLAHVVLTSDSFGPYIVEKLWLTFVSPKPDPAEIDRLTELWKDADLELMPILEGLLLTDAFWDESHRGAMIKSPVELLVGAVRATGREGVSLSEIAYFSQELGQELFAPPNVGGWPGGQDGGAAWINDSTVLLRATALTAFAERDYDTGRPRRTDMMLGDAVPRAKTAGPSGLRVGRVFGRWSEAWDAGGVTAVIRLFDVSLGEKSWRSLTLIFEREPGGELLVALPAHDCGPICPLPQDGVMRGEEDAVALVFVDGELETDRTLSAEAERILREVLGNLGPIVSETRNSLAWSPPFEEDEEETPAPFDDIASVAAAVAEAAGAIFGAPIAPFASGFSRNGSDGLSGFGMISDLEMLDGYFEEEEEKRARFSAPLHTYGTATEWVAALPSPDMAMETLLAVDLPEMPNAETLAARDPEAALKALLLSPAFQVK